MKPVILAAVLHSILLTLSVNGQQPSPREEFELNDGTTIAFRFCPPADSVRSGDPRTPSSGSHNLQGFYLSETELTQRQLEAILGQQVRLQIRRRLEKLPPGSPLRDYPDEEDYPAVCLSLAEAVQVCDELQTQLVNRGDSIEELAARLPSLVEWQYACRAGDLERHPHFGIWTVQWDAPLEFPDGSFYLRDKPHLNQMQSVQADSTLQEFCAAAWQQLGFDQDRPFERTQNDVLRIVEEFNRQLGNSSGPHTAIATSCLVQSIALRHDLPAMEDIQPFRSAWTSDAAGTPSEPTGRSNAWALADMQAGVREWIFMTSESSTLNGAWQALRDAVRTSPSAGADELKVGTAGAHTHSDQWDDFLVWTVKDSTTASELAGIPDEKKDVTWLSMRAGLRVLLMRSLRNDWLTMVRRVALNADPQQGRLDLEQFESTLNRLQTGSPSRLAHERLRFYRAVFRTRHSAPPQAATELARSISILGSDDPFFRFLDTALDPEI